MKLNTIDVKLTDPPAPFPLTEVNLKRAEDVLEITNSLRSHWSLTVRSYYYKVISHKVYKRKYWRSQGNRSRGKNLKNPEEQIGEILKYLRLSGRLSMKAVNDDSRIVTRKQGKTDLADHIGTHLSYMGIPYFNRCNAADQENYIEVWVEKNGLVHIARKVVDDFCRRTVGCKGFPSVTVLNEYASRARQATEAGQECIILYFGDLDPSGWLIPKTIKASLYHEHDIDIDIIRCGLNPSHITEDMMSIKLEGKKPIQDMFVKETGLTVGYELDLVDPDDLQKMVRDALVHHTDMEVLEIAEWQRDKDNDEIEEVNDAIEEAIRPVREKYSIYDGY